MPSINEIRTLTIRSQETGSDQAVRALQGIAAGQNQVASSAAAATEKSSAYDQALQKQQRSMELADSQAQRFAAAMSGVVAAQQLIAQVTQSQTDRVNAAAAANENYADSSSHVGAALRLATKAVIDHTAAYLATAGAIGAGVVLFGGLLTVVGEILLAYHALKLAIDLVTEAWSLGGAQLDKYREIAEKAAKVDLSADYFQRIGKAATDAKLPVDDLAKALDKLQQSSTEKLGGSDLEKKLNALSDAGNFDKSGGGDAFFQASTTQQKFEAIVKTIHDAMDAGERLAALDLANTAFGPEITARLRDDSEFLDRLVASAQKVAATDIVPDAEVARAVALKAQYDAAVAILEQRWHPIQQFLTNLGVQMQVAWVNIVSAVAAAVDAAISFAEKLAPVLTALQAIVGIGARIAVTAVPVVGTAVIAASIASSAGGDSGTSAAAAGYDKLRVAMQNYNNIAGAVRETNTVQNAVLRDTSKAAEDTAKEVEAVRNAFDRAIDAVKRHTDQTAADADAVGLGAGALARYRAEAQLMSAAVAAGVPITAELRARIRELADDAGDAAADLAKVQVASQIDFAKKTQFLSPQDVQIAQQLRGIYGNDIPAALASTEAAQLRVIDNVKQMRDGAVDFTKTFAQGLLQGKSLMDSLVAAVDQLAAKMADKAITDLFSGNFVQAGVEAAVAVGASLFSSDQKAAKQLKEAQETWAKAGPAFQKFLTAMTAGPQGSIADSLEQAYAQGQELFGKAQEAHDYAAEQRIVDAYNQYAATLKARFAALFEVTVAGLEDGLGANSPLLQAAQRVGQELASAQDFVGNANTTYGAGSAEAARAAKAEQDYLLTLLQTPAPLSAVQQGLLSIKGTAAALQGALEQLGLSSADAAAAISDGVGKAIDALAATFRQGLIARLNSANGQDYLNSAQTLLQQHAQDLGDAAALGGSPALLAQVQATFAAEAQKLVNDAGLVGDQFADFIKLFPQFSGVVTQATDKLTQSIQTVRDYLSQLSLGSNSILSPQQQLAQAQANFQRQFQAAAGGDQTALAGITQTASTLLDLAKGFYASSSGYTGIYNVVVSALSSLVGGASTGALDNSMFAGAGALSSSLPGAIAPQLTVSAANDNGNHFAQQTASLSQVFSQVGAAQILALQTGVADLGARLDRIAAAIEKRSDKPARPADRKAA